MNLSIFLSASLTLAFLIFNVKNSERFNIIDDRLHQRLIRNRDGFSWQVVAFLNDPKLMVVWAVLLASTLIDQNKYQTALWVLATLGGTDLAGIILKKLVRRQRPDLHSDMENGYSFPSGHVLGATSMALILVHLFGAKMGTGFVIGLLVIWLMVIISRLSLKAHYPSDILAATSLAIICFSITQQVFL